MLTGTLVTVASFLPIGLNSSNAGEYTFSLFVVIAISLLFSWLVAVVFTPLLGVTSPKAIKKHEQKPGRVSEDLPTMPDAAMRRAWMTVAISVGFFAGFKSSWIEVRSNSNFSRASTGVNCRRLHLPQNTSIAETSRDGPV